MKYIHYKYTKNHRNDCRYESGENKSKEIRVKRVNDANYFVKYHRV